MSRFGALETREVLGVKHRAGGGRQAGAGAGGGRQAGRQAGAGKTKRPPAVNRGP